MHNNNDSLIDHLLLNPIKRNGADHIVIIDKNQNYTYQQILEGVLHCAYSISLSRFKQGDIIACILPDSIEAIIIFLGLIYKGLLPCMINPNVSRETHQEYLVKSKCTALIAPQEKLPEFTEIAQSLALCFLSIESLIGLSSNACLLQIPPSVLSSAFYLFTSGTTGNPSLVLHRHCDPIIMNQHYGKAVLKLGEQDTIIATSRFYFAYGLNTLFFALLNKAVLVILPTAITPELIWQYITTYRPTVFFSVPTMYKRLLHAIPESRELSPFRLCISAGENLPSGIFNTWQQKTGLPILDGIGTTEILSTFISNRAEKFKPGSTGYPVPGFVAEIRDMETNQVINTGKVGVLWVKGQTYVPYYPNNQAESERRFIDGWFRTNDLFSIDDEGFYFYHGRANELIKVSGIWVFPYKIEEVLTKHPAVYEAIVCGIKETDGLMRIVGYVVLNDGYGADDSLTTELKNWCKHHGANHEYPHIIHYILAIPKTPSGKSKRFLLVQQNNQELAHVE